MRQTTLVIILFCARLTSFGQWEWQHPIPQAHTLKEIRFIDGIGYSASEGGTVLKTTDAGSTFEILDLPLRLYSTDAQFVNEQTGWVCGQGPQGHYYLLKTSDGGNSWEAQLVDSSQFLGRINFLNERLGWVNGGSHIWHTSDGGGTWTLQLDLVTNFVGSIVMFDSLRGIGAGDLGGVRTTNGGELWEIDTTIAPSSCLEFVDTLFGWATWGGQLLHTSDGGQSWEVQFDTSSHDMILRDLSMIDRQTGWVVGSLLWSGIVMKTTNGGQTWEHQSNATGAGLEAISFTDTNNGLAVGFWGAIMKTTDGGENWIQVNQKLSEGSQQDVHFVDENHGWVVGHGAAITSNLLRTTTGGNEWEITEIDVEHARALYFIDHLNGWVAGETKVMRTSDGGATWADKFVPLDGWWWDIELSFPPTGWIVGNENQDGLILKSEDGGLTWEDATNIVDLNQAYNIEFTSELVGWLRADAVYKTTNQGQSWEVVFDDEIARAMDFISDDVGWVATTQATYMTRDGGITWTTLDSPSSPWSIQFLDDTVGWMGFLGGEIQATTDGGKTWSRQFTTGYGTIRRFFFVLPDNGWAIGSGGTIMHMDLGGVTSVGDVSGGFEGDPISYTLHQSFPNPFNPSTAISFTIPRSGEVKLTIYSLLGEEIATLTSGHRDAGTHIVTWDASGHSSGVYFYRLEAGNFTETRKLVLVR